ncbi:MAG: DUF2975 domain-containing protein [Nocardioides sp.]|uniref:DUF2975 domain-containing protein n=1 Tax=Nocardioides sp. TaxID=35761 RepID=UPI0039E6ADC1
MASAVSAASAATVLAIGISALAGRTTYPVNVDLGPVHLYQDISAEVSLQEKVCQSASVVEQNGLNDCAPFFIHGSSRYQNDSATRLQDGNIKPQMATLTGTVALATTGGWSGFVAATVVSEVIKLVLLSVFLLMLWRLLSASATGMVFDERSVRWVRAMGWILIAGAALGAIRSVFIGPLKWGYSIEVFGPGPHLTPAADGAIDIMQIALGVLVLLLAEVFRRGTAVETENRLTV